MSRRTKPELAPPLFLMGLQEDEFQWVADIIKAKKLDAEKRDYARSFPKSWDLYVRLEQAVVRTRQSEEEFRAAEQARIDEEWENRPRRRRVKD